MESQDARASLFATGSGAPPLRLGDIQGLILRGYTFPYVRHFIFSIRDVPGASAGACKLCGDLRPGSGGPLTITTATEWPVNGRPRYCLNLGVTNTGLKKLIGDANYQTVNQGTSDDLFVPFDAGAAARAAQVGDTGPSDPRNWWQNPPGSWKLPSPPGSADLDVLISLYARSAADRDNFAGTLLDEVIAKILAGDGKPALETAFVQDSDPLPGPPNMIHFGYHDGISQPRLAGAWWSDPGSPMDDRPLVPAGYFAIANDPQLPYFAHPLLVDGSFGAFRLLFQDVGAFEAFIQQPGSDPELLAAKMCGRWRDGTPLEVSPLAPNPKLSGFELTNFDYLTPTPHQLGPRQSDGLGQECPYAAHIRRTNPRDDTDVQGNDDEAEQHRVMRRASAYGPPYAADPKAQRGLVGLFIGANLTQQFEFIMKTWISDNAFRVPDTSPNSSGADPLFGPQPEPPPPQGFTDFDYLPAGSSKHYKTIPGLSRFVRTDGGLYVFLPSVGALGWLAKGQIPPTPPAARR